MAQAIDLYIFEPFGITEKSENLHERMGNDEEQDYEGNSGRMEDRIDQNCWCLCGKCTSITNAR